ncbi:MAG: Tfx family DNA-binding protein [Halobacteriales archaeon]
MVEPAETFLTDRQVEVLRLREAGHTQREVADRIGTTDSNVSAVERAARENVAKARRTLELAQSIRSPGRITVAAGTSFDELVERIYEVGDETGVKIEYARPELYGWLYDKLEAHAEENVVRTAVEVAVTSEGDVTVEPVTG